MFPQAGMFTWPVGPGDGGVHERGGGAARVRRHEQPADVHRPAGHTREWPTLMSGPNVMLDSSSELLYFEN